MAYQNISAIISPEKLEEIQSSIENIKDSLPFLIRLNSIEKQGLRKITPKHIDIIKNCEEIAEKHPEILPAEFDTEEFLRDTKLTSILLHLKEILHELTEKIDDTTLAVSNEAIRSCAEVCESAHQATNHAELQQTLASRACGTKLMPEAKMFNHEHEEVFR